MLKEAVVTAAPEFPKMTAPGPLMTLQLKVRVDPAGSPSSVAEPVNEAAFGKVRVWSGPALTKGAWFARLTVMEMSSLRTICPSETVRRKTYVPAEVNAAEFAGESTGAKEVSPGPLICLQLMTGLPPGTLSEYVPCSGAVAGKVTVWSTPALTMMGSIFRAAFNAPVDVLLEPA